MSSARLIAKLSALALASLFAGLGPTACAPGGCPWVETSAVRIHPPVSNPDGDYQCLQVHVPNGSSDEEAPGGCVDPALVGTNHCDATLTIEAAEDGAWGALVVEPGGDFTLLLDLWTANVAETESRYFFEVPAWIGGERVELRFSTWID